MNVPDEVAVMTLPNAILFPRVLLPLYIFEPRYRQMLADSLDGERMFAIALANSSERHPPSKIGSVGIIRTSVLRPDGTSNLVLEGIARVQFIDYVQVQPYRIARIHPLESVPSSPVSSRENLLSAIQKFARAKARLGSQLPKAVLDSFLAVKDAGHLTDLAGFTLLDDSHKKQHLLETLDVDARLFDLIDFLNQQTDQFDFWKTLQGDLPNDDVGKN
jgi:Lon protease-like protein